MVGLGLRLKMECFSVGGYSEDCIGLPRMTSGCYSSREKRRDEACFKFVRRCTRWSRIGKSRSSNDRNGRRSWKGKGGRPLRRLHWLASESLWVIVHIEAETLTRDPYYRRPWQDSPTGAGSVESGGSGPATPSQS